MDFTIVTPCPTARSGTFTQISAGAFHFCWGKNDYNLKEIFLDLRTVLCSDTINFVAKFIEFNSYFRVLNAEFWIGGRKFER